jgi:hypothetical protein
MKPYLFLSVPLLLAGCASRPTVPEVVLPEFIKAPAAPRAPSPIVITPTQLQSLKDAIARARVEPRIPSGRPLTPAEFINKPALFSGTMASLDLASSRVAVLGSSKHHGDDGVGRFVSDALFAALQSRGIEVVDREYVGFVTTEFERIEAGRVETEDQVDLDSRLAGVMAADYAILIHSIYDNLEGADPQKLDLPLDIPPLEWADYLDDRQNYLQAIQAERGDVENYNSRRDSFINEYALQIFGQDDAWKDYDRAYRDYSRSYDDHVESSRIHGLRPKAKEEQASLRYKLPDRVKLPTRTRSKEEKRMDEIRGQIEDLLGRNLDRVDPTTGVNPLLLPTDRRAFLGDNASNVSLTAIETVHKFMVSIRVIHLGTGGTVWVGNAEAQNLRFISAVAECCDKLAGSLTGLK